MLHVPDALKVAYALAAASIATSSAPRSGIAGIVPTLSRCRAAVTSCSAASNPAPSSEARAPTASVARLACRSCQGAESEGERYD